jgi:two-component system sensor histidine kinase BarA
MIASQAQTKTLTMLKKSLQQQILVAVLIPSIIFVIIITYSMLAMCFSDAHKIFHARNQITLTKYALAFEQLSGFDNNKLQEIAGSILDEPNVRSIGLFDAHNKELLHSGPRFRSPNTMQLDQKLNQYDQNETWLYVMPLPKTTRYTSDAEKKLWVKIEFSTQNLKINQYEHSIKAIFLVLFILAIIYFIQIKILQKKLNPISQITETLKRIDSRHLNVRITTDSDSELKNLENELNEMLNRIATDMIDLQTSMEQTNEDLRETMEAMEVQNIELTLARKEAVEGNRVKSEFLANISHEIRTPLNGIMGFAKLLLKSPLNGRQLDYTKTIQKSADGLLAIINDVLDFSKIEAGKLELDNTPLDIEEIIFDVMNMLAPSAEEKNIEQIAIIYHDAPCYLIGDPLRLKQILTNLINNAIKFTPTGEVTVRCMLEDLKDNIATLRFSVTDTGIGLSDSARADLFQAFSQGDPSTTRRFGGTGLGLVISRYLVEQMHGVIGFDSVKGEGSTFWFTIRAQLDKHTQPLLNTEFLENRKILIAEEHNITRQYLDATLNNWGVNTTSINSLENISNLNTSFDAIIINHYLFKNRNINNNAELLALQKELKSPVILLRRSTDFTEENNDPKNKNIQYLTKPVSPRLLHLALTNTLLDGSASSTETYQSPERKLKILAVDDNLANLKLICALLGDLFIDVSEAHDGYEAIELLKHNQFDLVFMDIQMPGMSGIKTTEIIRSNEAQQNNLATPIIALTAHAMGNEKEELLRVGMNDYLTKPIDENQLTHIIQKWTGFDPKHQQPRQITTSNDISSDSILDWEESLKLASNKADLAKDMLNMLIKGLPEQCKKIQRYLDENHLEALLEQVHYLHGGTRYCGVPSLRNACHECESSIKSALEGGFKHGRNNTYREHTELVLKHAKKLLTWVEKNGLPD